MVETKTKRTVISLTPDDAKLIRALKIQLKPEHGKLTSAAIVRMCLRKAKV
jgi:hypothetical protein